MAVIEFRNVSKFYKAPVKPEPGFWNTVKSVFYRKWVDKEIIKNVSFSVDEGEFVGYIGPNGAGKSTSIKLLTGVLTPSSGFVSVLGFSPTKQRYEYTYNIGVVFGHRSLLEFDIPVIESFRLFKAIYELDDGVFEERLKFFTDMLKIGELLHVPVRKLSLGERMRCELAASLLHRPKVIFLDEPTIGLDAVSKEEIRKFLTRINREEKVTIILTTHDMDDIEELCSRIILIDDGSIVYDGSLEKFKDKFIVHKSIVFDLLKVSNKKKFDELLKFGEVEREGRSITLSVDVKKHSIPKVVDKLLDCAVVEDLSVQTPRLEHIIKEVYELKKK